jgi:hypothetical protein
MIDHATQASKVLQDMNEEFISARTIGRALKEAKMKAVMKKKRPRLIKRHRRERGWTLHWHIRTGLWRTGRGLFGQMRLKSIVWG